MAHSARRMFGVARRLPTTALNVATSTMRDPVHAATNLSAPFVLLAASSAPATEPMSPVMRDRGLGRRLDLFDLPLDDLKRAAKATTAASTTSSSPRSSGVCTGTINVTASAPIRCA